MALVAVHNEHALLEAVAGGSEKAFAALFYAYHQQLAGFVMLLTDSTEMTEEIIQDVFVKIWMEREKLTALDKFTSYLFILARNYTLNCIRNLATSRQREMRYIAQLSNTETDPEFLSFGNDPAYQQLMERAVAQLPPQQQKVYTLSRHEGLKHAQIAAQLGLSKETVKKYIQWATASIANFVKTHKEVLSILIAASYGR